jgi:hypothetical protein
MKQIYGNSTPKIIIMNHNDDEYLWKEWQAIHQNMKLYINQVYEIFNLTHQGPKKKNGVFYTCHTPKELRHL